VPEKGRRPISGQFDGEPFLLEVFQKFFGGIFVSDEAVNVVEVTEANEVCPADFAGIGNQDDLVSGGKDGVVNAAVEQIAAIDVAVGVDGFDA